MISQWVAHTANAAPATIQFDETDHYYHSASPDIIIKERQYRHDGNAAMPPWLAPGMRQNMQLLARKDGLGRPSDGKRRKKDDRESHLKSTAASDFTGWKPLADIYKELGDNDVLTGIYDKHLAHHSITHDAIHHELEGDYARAMVLYDQGLAVADEEDFDWHGEEPSWEERNLWLDGRLECLKNLTQWDELHQHARGEVDNRLEDLWQALDPRCDEGAFADRLLLLGAQVLWLDEHHATALHKIEGAEQTKRARPTREAHVRQ